MLLTAKEVFGVARGTVAPIASGIFAKFGVYILIALAAAAGTYHFIAVSNAEAEGARAANEANRVAADKAIEKVRLANQVRVKRLNSQLNLQRAAADQEASTWAKYSLSLERELESMKDNKTCWPKKVTRSIYK